MAKRKKKKVTMRAGGGTVASKTGRPIFTTSMPDIQAMPADTSLLMSRQTMVEGSYQPFQNIKQSKGVYEIDPCRAATRAKGEPRLRRGVHAEILFLGPGPAAQLGVAPGEYVRLCFAVGKQGYLIAVRNAYEASLIVRELEWQLRKGRNRDLEAAARLVASRAGQVTLGDVGGYCNVLDERRG